MATKIDIGQLKRMLDDRDISLGKLSKITGISKSHLSLMFNGKRNMTVKKLNLILEACNINAVDISQL